MALQFSFYLVLTNVLIANIRRIIHEGLPYHSRRECRHITDLIDQSFGSRCGIKEQEQGYSPPFNRCQLWFKSHLVCSFFATTNLRNVDVFLRAGATLTLAHGRRYGLIGRNGNHFPVSVVIRSFITASCHRCW